MKIEISGYIHRILIGILVIFAVIWILKPEQREPLKAATEQAAVIAQQESRFFEAPVNTGKGSILVDKETGVCYYYVKVFNSGGMTVLVDADGKPMIWEEDERNE